MSIFWHNARRIFWFNFNKPHQKFRLLLENGIQVKPVQQRGNKPVLPQSRTFQHRTQLFAVHKSLSSLPLLSVKSRQLVPVQQFRWFHKTPPNAIPPLLWTVIKPIGKLWAMLWGRSVRKWWARVPADKRAHYKEMFGGLKGIIISLALALALAFTLNYYLHLQTNPVTGRVRFISLSQDQSRHLLNTCI